MNDILDDFNFGKKRKSFYQKTKESIMTAISALIMHAFGILQGHTQVENFAGETRDLFPDAAYLLAGLLLAHFVLNLVVKSSEDLVDFVEDVDDKMKHKFFPLLFLSSITQSLVFCTGMCASTFYYGRILLIIETAKYTLLVFVLFLVLYAPYIWYQLRKKTK